jgi:hypothetical protein
MFIKYDSRKLKAYILKKDNTSTNDDFFFFIQVSTSSIVMKQTESVFLQGFITPTYYHRKWEREKERDRERCLFFKYRRRKNLKQNITHQFRSQSMLLFILTESSIYIYMRTNEYDLISDFLVVFFFQSSTFSWNNLSFTLLTFSFLLFSKGMGKNVRTYSLN